VPVIAITRIDHPLAVAGMLDAGADVVVVKPVNGNELRARVAAALRTRSHYVDLMRKRRGR
jgi:DNA-binding response OmpR family regulator